MQYTQENVMLSIFVNLAQHLRQDGWSVFWHSSGQTEAHTAGSSKGTITLIQAIPATPTFITQGTRANQDEIVIPALAIQVSPTRRLDRYGLGDSRFHREMQVRIGGIAGNDREQRTIAKSLIEWSDVGEVNVHFPVYDYTNPNAPVELQHAELWWAHTTTPEVATEVENVRYRINTELILRYVE